MASSNFLSDTEVLPGFENILREFVDRRAQARKGARAVAAINRHAVQLNSEMSDALTFQVNSADE